MNFLDVKMDVTSSFFEYFGCRIFEYFGCGCWMLDVDVDVAIHIQHPAYYGCG